MDLKMSRLIGRIRRVEDVVREDQRSEEEWRRALSAEQYRVLRARGTERSFSGPAVKPNSSGQYCCAGCGAPLFEEGKKFESGTGWPSFTDALEGNVELKRDFSLGLPRTEVVCHRCGGHLGHVFGDGPAPTRKRYCINATALALDPKTS